MSRRVLLTVRNVPTLPAEDARETIWWDRTTPGFYLAVHPPSTRFPQGVRSFGVWYRVLGRARQKRLGRHPVVGLATSRARAREILEAARLRGVDLVGVPGAGTLAQIVASFIAAARSERPRTREDVTLKGYERLLDVHIRKARAGQVSLTELRRRDVSEMLRPIAAESVSTARRIFDLVRVACAWAMHEDLIASDPTIGVKRPAGEESRTRVLRDEEIVIFWHVTALDRSREKMALARLLLLTAQRSGETMMLEGAELDRGARLWHIPAEHRKGRRGKRRPHDVPLSGAALAVLDELPIGPGPAFPSMMRNRLKWAFTLQERARKMGLNGWTPHDLRRTAASGMARLGTSRSVIAMILGHAIPEGGAVTGTYDRYDRMPERAVALEAWGDHVAEIVSGKV